MAKGSYNVNASLTQPGTAYPGGSNTFNEAGPGQGPSNQPDPFEGGAPGKGAPGIFNGGGRTNAPGWGGMPEDSPGVVGGQARGMRAPMSVQQALQMMLSHGSNQGRFQGNGQGQGRGSMGMGMGGAGGLIGAMLGHGKFGTGVGPGVNNNLNGGKFNPTPGQLGGPGLLAGGKGQTPIPRPVTNGGQGTAAYNPQQAMFSGVPMPTGHVGYDDTSVNVDPVALARQAFTSNQGGGDNGGLNLGNIQPTYSAGNINDLSAGGNLYNPVAQSMGQWQAEAAHPVNPGTPGIQQGLQSGMYVKHADGQIYNNTDPAFMKQMAAQQMAGLDQGAQAKFGGWLSGWNGK